MDIIMVVYSSEVNVEFKDNVYYNTKTMYNDDLY